jgi:hypothetical protein
VLPLQLEFHRKHLQLFCQMACFQYSLVYWISGDTPIAVSNAKLCQARELENELRSNRRFRLCRRQENQRASDDAIRGSRLYTLPRYFAKLLTTDRSRLGLGKRRAQPVHRKA